MHIHVVWHGNAKEKNVLHYALTSMPCHAGGAAADTSNSGLATWIIIVIAVGATAVIVIAVLIILCCCLTRIRRQEHARHAQVRPAIADCQLALHAPGDATLTTCTCGMILQRVC